MFIGHVFIFFGETSIQILRPCWILRLFFIFNILDASRLLDIWFVYIFSHSVVRVFFLVLFVAQKVFKASFNVTYGSLYFSI